MDRVRSSMDINALRESYRELTPRKLALGGAGGEAGGAPATPVAAMAMAPAGERALTPDTQQLVSRVMARSMENFR